MRGAHVTSGAQRDADGDLKTLERVEGPRPFFQPPGRQFQELWFLLARKPWRSLALVPADEGGSAREIAFSLAQVGRMLHEAVTVFQFAGGLDPASATAVADSSTPETRSTALRPLERTGRFIAALQPVISEPLGLATATGADAVVLCIEVGKTRLDAARRTIELIGRDRVSGCLLVR